MLIVYSRHSSVQVYVRTMPLPEMMTSKIGKLLCREIRAEERRKPGGS
jgi:hypothetical protein